MMFSGLVGAFIQVKASLGARMEDRLLRKRGQGMVEYALILVLVSIVVIVLLLSMGRQVKNVFSNIVSSLGT